MVSRLFYFAIVMSVSGCSNLVSQKRADIFMQNETALPGKVASMPAQLRNIYIKNQIGSYFSCAEPGPDVALSDTFKLIAGATSDVSLGSDSEAGSASAGKKLAANADFQTSTAALELAGRTQTVLLARELLFRTCEYASNGSLSADDVKEAHKSIVNAIREMTAADKSNAAAKASTAAAVATVVGADKLDAALLNRAAAAADEANRNFCTSQFESCLNDAQDDPSKKQCKAQINDCLK
jgi:hypothetical protein